MNGCAGMSDAKDETPAVEYAARSVDEVREEARAAAVHLDELMAASTEPPTVPSRRQACSADYDRVDLFSSRASWSLRGVPDGDMEAGMTRMRDGLEAEGWEIVMFESNSSPVGALELRAENSAKGLFARAEFADARTGRLPEGQESDVRVTVFTQCYTDPDAR